MPLIFILVLQKYYFTTPSAQNRKRHWLSIVKNDIIMSVSLVVLLSE